MQTACAGPAIQPILPVARGDAALGLELRECFGQRTDAENGVQTVTGMLQLRPRELYLFERSRKPLRAEDRVPVTSLAAPDG